MMVGSITHVCVYILGDILGDADPYRVILFCNALAFIFVVVIFAQAFAFIFGYLIMFFTHDLIC